MNKTTKNIYIGTGTVAILAGLVIILSLTGVWPASILDNCEDASADSATGANILVQTCSEKVSDTKIQVRCLCQPYRQCNLYKDAGTCTAEGCGGVKLDSYLSGSFTDDPAYEYISDGTPVTFTCWGMNRDAFAYSSQSYNSQPGPNPPEPENMVLGAFGLALFGYAAFAGYKLFRG